MMQTQSNDKEFTTIQGEHANKTSEVLHKDSTSSVNVLRNNTQQETNNFIEKTDLEMAKAETLEPGTVMMTPEEFKSFKKEGFRVVLGGILVHLVLGTFYMWGTISLYVASWLRAEDPSIDISIVKMVFPFMNLAMNITMYYGLVLGAKIGPRRLCMIGISLIALFTFVSSWITNFAGFLMLYGIGVGLANGLIYMIPINCGWKYFPQKKGAVSGWIIGGFGFGSFIFNYVSLALINPSNASPSAISDGTKYFTQDIYEGVPKMLRILGACYLVVGLIGSLLIKTPSVLPANPEYKAPPKMAKSVKKVNKGVETFFEGFFTINCLMLVSIMFGGTFYGLTMTNNYKVYGMEKIPDDLFLTTVGSVGSAMNGCARVFWATLSDRFGFKKVMSILLIIQCIFCPTYDLISSSKGAFFLWYCVAMATEGGLLALLPAVTGRVFGPKKGSQIYSVVFFGLTTANLAAFFVSKYGQKSLGWNGIFWLSFGFTIFALVLTILFDEYPDFTKKKPKKIENQKNLEDGSSGETKSENKI